MQNSTLPIRNTAHRARPPKPSIFAAWAVMLGLLLVATSSLRAAAVIGGQLFATGGDVTVEVLPATAGFVSELRLYSPGPERLIALNTDVGTIVNLGSFTAGEELIFGIYVRDTGDTFKMGPASRNTDNLEHAGVNSTGLGEAIVGFEDLLDGGDRDYDDNVFKFTGGIAPLACPADIVVPADPGSCPSDGGQQQGTSGFAPPPSLPGVPFAVVNFTVPTVPGATVTCFPPSGTQFPVGTNIVTCTATYTRGDVVTCSFTIVVLPGRAAKQCVFNQLVALRATVTDRKDGAKLDEATLDDLAESLVPNLWVDELHLNAKLGGAVFQEERETSKVLCALMKKNNSHIPPALLQFFVTQLLAVDRTIAVVAINEAAAAGVPAKTIEKARKQLAKGDAEVTGYKGFDYYKSAWKLVVR